MTNAFANVKIQMITAAAVKTTKTKTSAVTTDRQVI